MPAIDLALLPEEALYGLAKGLRAADPASSQSPTLDKAAYEAVINELEQCRGERICYAHLEPLTHPDACAVCEQNDELRRELAGDS